MKQRWDQTLVHQCSQNIRQNGQMEETTQLSISGWMDTQNVVPPDYGRPASLKKEGNSDVGYNMHKPWCYAQGNKPVTKAQTLPDSTLLLLFCHEVVSDSATPWTIVHRAPLSMGLPKPSILGWVAISFSRGLSYTRDQTRVPCISRWILYHWATWGLFLGDIQFSHKKLTILDWQQRNVGYQNKPSNQGICLLFGWQ